MIRVFCLIGALCGGAGLSQFPEFSQQYIQRLAGQVDALTLVVKDFDASALAAGLGREEALEQMAGTAFLESRQADMRRSFARHARLSENLQFLRAAGPLARLAAPHRMADPALLQATWVDYVPALPLSVAGIGAGSAGFIGGWAGFAALWALFIWPLRRLVAGRPAPARKQEPGVKREPVLRPPVPVAPPQSRIPKLAGARR